MKLSISNIAWSVEQDEKIYSLLKANGFTGLEIAPTRIFPKEPYKHLDKAKEWAILLKKQYGLSISSMQSIWYGRSEKIFGTEDERIVLKDYTKQVVDFAAIVGCTNLVFGCPKNRNMSSESNIETAIDFFNNIANYAVQKDVVIALEPNPVIYNTNFINTTKQAFEFVKRIDNPSLLVNIDCGTIIENNENLEIIEENIHLVNHIHISEPNLDVIKKRNLHKELAKLLKKTSYDKFVSIEMKNFDDVEILKQTIEYIKEIFYDI